MAIPSRSLLLSRVCFSIKVALAGKIAGECEEQSTHPGAQFPGDDARCGGNQTSE